jgi:hypothetical protein
MAKVYPLPAGGFVASGPVAAWGEWLYTRLKDTDGSLEQIVATTREQAPKMLSDLETARVATVGREGPRTARLHQPLGQ